MPTALITGANRGLGCAIARAYAAEGARVLLAGRNEDALARLAGELRSQGGKAEVLAVDLEDSDSVRRLAARVSSLVQSLDIFVANAAVLGAALGVFGTGTRWPDLPLTVSRTTATLAANEQQRVLAYPSFVGDRVRVRPSDGGAWHMDPETSRDLADLTVAYKNRGVVAFDLAGAEYNYPAKKHRDAFFTVINRNMAATIHAGEAYGPESIHQALHYCRADRIGHGTRLHEDPDLLRYVRDPGAGA